MRTDEVGNELVFEPCLPTDGIESALGLKKEFERWFTHQRQDFRTCVLRCYFKSSADVVEHHMAEIIPAAVLFGEKVAADSAADIDMLNAGHGQDFLVEGHQRAMVGVEVGADGGLDAAVAGAAAAQLLVFARHAVHVGRRAAKVGDDSVEVLTLGEDFHLLDNGAFGTAGYLLALVGGDGAERATPETAAVNIYGVLNHLIRRYGSALFVLGMRQTGVGQVETGINLLGAHGWLRRIDHNPAVGMALHQGGALYLIAFPLDDLVVLRLGTLAAATLLEGVELDNRRILSYRSTLIPNKLNTLVGLIGHLWKAIECFDGFPLGQQGGHLEGGALAHAIVEEVGRGVGKNAGEKAVVPIIVVCKAAHGGLDAGKDDGDRGIELFEDAGVDISGAVWTETSLTARGVGIVVTQTAGSGVVVHHAVHGSAGDAKEKARCAELAEVAQVVAPVGLRDDGHPIARSLKGAPYDSGAKGRMVHICIASDKHHIHGVPSQPPDLVQSDRQKMRHDN